MRGKSELVINEAERMQGTQSVLQAQEQLVFQDGGHSEALYENEVESKLRGSLEPLQLKCTKYFCCNYILMMKNL